LPLPRSADEFQFPLAFLPAVVRAVTGALPGLRSPLSVLRGLGSANKLAERVSQVPTL